MPIPPVCSPPARSAAVSVVAHFSSVGSEGAYLSARISGSVSASPLLFATACDRLSPSLDSLIPSRIAFLITKYSIQKNTITAISSIAAEKIAMRVSSASNVFQFIVCALSVALIVALLGGY